MKTTMGVKLDENIRERLKVLAAAKDRSPHWLMKKAIQEYLEREEAYERERQDDLQRWERYQETGEYIGHEEAKTRLTDLAKRARTHAKTTG